MDNGPKDGQRWTVDRHDEMAAFDRLSPRLRRVLNDLPKNFCALEVQTLLLDGDTEDEVIRELHKACKA